MTTEEEPKYPPIIRAPFTYGQIQALNNYQKSGKMHPFLCGNLRGGKHPVMVAGRDGWVCPDETCEYTQNWAHGFMADETLWPSIGKAAEPVTMFSQETQDRLIKAIQDEAYKCDGPDGNCKLAEEDCVKLHGIRWDGVTGNETMVSADTSFLVAFVLGELSKLGHGDDCTNEGACTAPLTFGQSMTIVPEGAQIVVNHGEAEEYLTLAQEDVEMIHDMTGELLGAGKGDRKTREDAMRIASGMHPPFDNAKSLIGRARSIERYLTGS